MVHIDRQGRANSESGNKLGDQFIVQTKRSASKQPICGVSVIAAFSI